MATHPRRSGSIFTLQPQPDGTLVGDSVRASTDSLCAAKRTVKFTRTGDADPNKVPDPAVLPPRAISPADGLRGSYRQTTTFANGNILPGQVLTANTYCLRTGDRCMSLFHAGGQAVTLMYADQKWTRNETGHNDVRGGRHGEGDDHRRVPDAADAGRSDLGAHRPRHSDDCAGKRMHRRRGFRGQVRAHGRLARRRA